ncbi:MAG TPA: hypothetical protein VES73_06020 [Lamprocystis sp. (in: g-proteobacteria)]|nr:hypothetical protein [Lamprocystis sp. (in: g-proteobacteria)]
MAEFFASGRAVDLVLLLMGLEGIVLMMFWRRRGCGIPPTALLLILASGGCLLLAVRAALTGAPWVWVSFFLLASLVVHLVDLRLRWQQRPINVTPDHER